MLRQVAVQGGAPLAPAETLSSPTYLFYCHRSSLTGKHLKLIDLDNAGP